MSLELTSCNLLARRAAVRRSERQGLLTLRTRRTRETKVMPVCTKSQQAQRLEKFNRRMRGNCVGSAVAVLTLAVSGFAGTFVVFPKAGELASPDGRFVVRNADVKRSAGEFAGTFRSLWLIESATGRSRKLCDYLGVAAVGWSSEDFLIVTQYVSRKSSRVVVFSATDPDISVMLDSGALIQLVPAEMRGSLRENDHVFVEGSRVEEETLYLRVWGYGRRDADGFRWSCTYGLRQGNISCGEEPHPH